MANTKISALTALVNPTWSEEFVYAYNNANGKVTLNTMKSFIAWWGGGVTTLNADANIWELAEWFYESEYKLFYKSWEDITGKTSSLTVKTLLFVTTNSGGGKWYFAFGEKESSWTCISYAYYGYSKDSADWEANQLRKRDQVFTQYSLYTRTPLQSSLTAFSKDSLTQIIDWISGTDYLSVSGGNSPFPWVTYTVYISSVASGQNYTIDLWTWVTNPLNIALPTSSNKKCVITCLITSATTAIVTGCTIEA